MATVLPGLTELSGPVALHRITSDGRCDAATEHRPAAKTRPTLRRMRGAEVVTASVRQRVEQGVDPERVAVHGELVEVARVVSLALEGVAEVGVVRDENDQPAVRIGDTTC